MLTSHIQEYIHANWACGYERVKQFSMYLFRPQYQEQHSSSLKRQWWEAGKNHLRKRFIQHLSNGRKPCMEYLAQKLSLTSWPALKCFSIPLCRQFPEAPSGCGYTAKLEFLLHPNSSNTKGYHIVNGIMGTLNSLRTQTSIFRIRRKEIIAIDTEWVKPGSVQVCSGPQNSYHAGQQDKTT